MKDHKQVHIDQITYPCDLCDYEGTSDDHLAEHKHSKHASQGKVSKPVLEVGKEPLPELEKENDELKRKLRTIEENYDRLMLIFQKQQTEMKDKILAFKIQVETATESYRVAKTENEKLKEVNDIQQKLWKVFLNKFEKEEAVKKNDNSDPKPNPASPEPVDEEIVVKTVDENEDIDLEATYEEWLTDTRRRGFKRGAPKNAAEYNRVQKERTEERTRSQNNAPPRSHSPAGNDGPRQEVIRYCHFWNNHGKCTLNNCVYAHQTPAAPQI